jgi:hypothetical protein
MSRESRLTDGTEESLEYRRAQREFGAEPALGVITLDDDGQPRMDFVNGYDFTDEATYMMEEVDKMIPQLIHENRQRSQRAIARPAGVGVRNLTRYSSPSYETQVSGSRPHERVIAAVAEKAKSLMRYVYENAISLPIIFDD